MSFNISIIHRYDFSYLKKRIGKIIEHGFNLAFQNFGLSLVESNIHCHVAML